MFGFSRITHYFVWDNASQSTKSQYILKIWEGAWPRWPTIGYRYGANPYAHYYMESLTNKFTNKYIYFYSLFKVRGLETKDNH